MEKHKFIGKSKDEAIQQAKISLEESNIDNLFIISRNKTQQNKKDPTYKSQVFL